LPFLSFSLKLSFLSYSLHFFFPVQPWVQERKELLEFSSSSGVFMKLPLINFMLFFSLIVDIFLTTLLNFDRSKILTTYKTICEEIPRKISARFDGRIEHYA